MTKQSRSENRSMARTFGHRPEFCIAKLQGDKGVARSPRSLRSSFEKGSLESETDQVSNTIGDGRSGDAEENLASASPDPVEARNQRTNQSKDKETTR